MKKAEAPWEKAARAAAVKTARRNLGRRKMCNLDERRQWTASSRLDVEEMAQFLDACEATGTTRYAVIKAMIREYIKANCPQ